MGREIAWNLLDTSTYVQRFIWFYRGKKRSKGAKGL
jgi:hypothetical protein